MQWLIIIFNVISLFFYILLSLSYDNKGCPLLHGVIVMSYRKIIITVATKFRLLNVTIWRAIEVLYIRNLQIRDIVRVLQ
jgi:hypothetical protein